MQTWTKNIKYLPFIPILLLCANLAQCQSLFFISDKSYQCTETFTLKSNSIYRGYSLDVLIAKDGDQGIIAVSAHVGSSGIRIKGNIFIYLEDGSVITCLDRNIFDNVDFVATTMYYLTKDELKKMKTSNLNTIQFSLGCYGKTISSSIEGTYSASNKAFYQQEKTDVPKIIIELFE